MSDPIRVLIAEDEPLLRQSLSMLIGLDTAFAVVGEAPNGQVAWKMALESRPCVILTDLEMPLMNGIDLCRKASKELHETHVVVLTRFGDDENLFAAVKAGAIGYLLKDSGVEEIRAAIADAAQGLGRLSPALVARVLEEFRRFQTIDLQRKSLLSQLTRREVEVLELIAKGQRNKTIASDLCLSEKTVKAHVGAVLRKLHVLDRTEAALLAQKHGIS